MTAVFKKLNLKDQVEILILNAPQSFEPEIESLEQVTVIRSLHKIQEIAFSLAFVTEQAEVDQLTAAISAKTKGDALIWFAYPKGTSRKYKCNINRDHGWDALGAAGFEVVRSVAIDEDWSAVRFRRVEYIKTLSRAPQFAATAEGKKKAKGVQSQAQGLKLQAADGLPKKKSVDWTRKLAQVTLRNVIESDLPIFFENQQDPEANYMAAFTSRDPNDRAAFDAHWNKILADEKILIQTIEYKKKVAGSVLSYEIEGQLEIGYWIGKDFWGKGIASAALALFLKKQTKRPIFARAAKDNIASLRVLEKSGFRIIELSKGFANARGEEIEEYLLRLD